MTKKELIEEIIKLNDSYTKSFLMKKKKDELEDLLNGLKQDSGNLLSLSKAKEISKKYDEIETYELHDGSVYKFYPFFSSELIEDMLIDIQNLLADATEKEINLPDNIYYHLINLVIIKHASPALKEQFEEGILKHLDALKWLRNAGYYYEIMTDVLVSEEVQKVRDAIVEKVAEGNVLQKMIEKVTEKMEEVELKNKHLIEGLNKVVKTKG